MHRSYGLLSDLAAAAICTLRKVKEGRPEKQILAALDALRLTCHCIQLRRDAQSDIENIVMKLTRFFSSRVEVERKLQPHINAALLRTMILVSGEGANFWSEAIVRFAFETFVTTCDMPDILLDDASQLALLSSVSYLVRTSENEDALPVLVDLAALHQEALWPALLRALSLTSARVTSVVLLNVFSNQARVRFRAPASIYQRLAQLSGMSPPDGNGQGDGSSALVTLSNLLLRGPSGGEAEEGVLADLGAAQSPFVLHLVAWARFDVGLSGEGWTKTRQAWLLTLLRAAQSSEEIRRALVREHAVELVRRYTFNASSSGSEFLRDLVLESLEDPRRSGLTDEELASLDVQVVCEDEASDSGGVACAICLSQLGVGQEVITSRVGHRYHADCITPWLRRSRLDPLTRAPFIAIVGIVSQATDLDDHRARDSDAVEDVVISE